MARNGHTSNEDHFVSVRPGTAAFLGAAAGLFDLCVFTAGCKEYADKVAAQLYYEQWTLSSLHSISSSRLEEVLKNMRVKEGAVHALLQFFCTTPRGGSSSWKELTTDSEDNGRGERARRES